MVKKSTNLSNFQHITLGQTKGGLRIQRRHMCIAPCGNASPRCPRPSSASPSRPPCRRPCPRAARSCRRGSCKSTAPARRRTGTGLSCGELYASEDLMIRVNLPIFQSLQFFGKFKGSFLMSTKVITIIIHWFCRFCSFLEGSIFSRMPPDL